MQGYYNHASRSATELAPVRTGSGFGSHPLTERSFSHRSEGRQSSSGQSHHSARTYSLNLDSSRASCSSNTATPASKQPVLPPPPGLFILGPVPCIIRCWLTANFSNDSLLYAAVCTGSYSSAITRGLLQTLGLEGDILVEGGVQIVKLPVYLPEASVRQPSSRGGSPEPHLPALTVRFLVRDTQPEDDRSIAIFIGSDVLRVHNADILFSQDKMLLVDDERNRISIPLVRPEDHDSFKVLATGPQRTQVQPSETTSKEKVPAQESNQPSELAGVIGQRRSSPQRVPSKSALSLKTSSDVLDGHNKPRSTHFADDPETISPEPAPRSASTEKSLGKSTKSDESSGVWGPWRRDTTPAPSSTKPEPVSYLAASQRSVRPRNMTVLKPTKASSRPVSGGTPSSASASSFDRPLSRSGDGMSRSTRANGENGEHSSPAPGHTSNAKSSAGDGTWTQKTRSANPIGGASAFGWLNTRQNPASTG